MILAGCHAAEQHFVKKLRTRSRGSLKIMIADMQICYCEATFLSKVANMQLRKSFLQVLEVQCAFRVPASGNLRPVKVYSHAH